ncbi:hypothetical protein [Streptomyces sp. JJ38]|uniref:hypothetical protein n=1 Tax=Streptomyces sp. JJ38 TaxID=2738128 RepID=UPI001C578390|nr:hypothetical protein [Streptomyces sp. JJ38]MBW1597847.1 hypothetical protein [Streptomyces sp. JJ38]
MINSKYARVGLVSAATATMLLFTATPALAANFRISLPYDRGYMQYIDDGDVFTVCDTKADGHGVTGYVRRLMLDGRIITLATIDDGGDAGCDKKGVDINRQAHDIVLCWNGGGPCVVSRPFEE